MATGAVVGEEPKMADAKLIAEAASQLRTAVETGNPCGPVRGSFADNDLESAYAIQQLNRDLDCAAGRRIVGHKIGLTSPVVQAQLGVDTPDFGTLFADMVYADGVAISCSRLMQPKVEAEVALVLDEDLDQETHSVLDVLNATAYALPALEIVDSRIADWNIRAIDTIADNGSSGLLTLGSKPMSLADFDVLDIEMSMTKNGAVESTGVGAACLGNPLNAVVWLADMLAQLKVPLRAGDVILTGSLGPMVDVVPGDEIVADLGVLGRVRTSFVAQPTTFVNQRSDLVPSALGSRFA